MLDALFHFLCHQNAARSFVIGGHLLPFCQRCTGLYIGMGIACVTLFSTGAYKKGLPPKTILYTNILCLLIMPVFGYHLLDPGPSWRLWSGLIYGAAMAHLFLPATVLITRPVPEDYSPVCRIAFWLQFVFVNTLALWFPVQSTGCRYIALTLACFGLLVMAGCLMTCVSVLVRKILTCFIWKGICHEQTER